MSSDFTDFMTEIWHRQPILIVLLVAGAVLFTLLVIDTYRHRKKRKKERPSIKDRH